MSTQLVTEQVQRFLRTPNPEVLSIRGAWGVGKTHSWDEMLRISKEKNKIALTKYSYVSLFGINSIDSFKLSIFENLVGTSYIGKEPDLETFKENAGGVVTALSRGWLNKITDIPILRGFGTIVESVSFLSVKEAIVCIDDFERKGDSLTPKEILGLVSLLKEQKKCKVVLILNDKSFGDDDSDEYRMYREKVIDVELHFEPTVKELSDIAFRDKTAINTRLIELTSKLRIRNIRILFKIKKLSSEIEKALAVFEPEVLNQAIHTLCLYCVAFFGKDKLIPSLDYLRTLGHKMYGLDDEEEVEEQEKAWRTTLREYGYHHTDELDFLIADAVQSGYLNEGKLLDEAEALNQRTIATKSENSFTKAWETYHNSFNNNEEEVVQSLYEAFTANYKYITPYNLDGTVRLFRELGRCDKADDLVEYYVSNRIEESGLFDLSSYSFRGEIKDKKVIDEFNNAYSGVKETKTVKEVLANIAGKDSWGGDDVKILSSASVDVYYNLFKNEKGNHLDSWINTCLRFGKFTNADEDCRKIANTVKHALERIGSESKLNSIRVAKFGISLVKK